MLENYNITNEGVIYQVKKKPFNYNSNYIETYNNYGEIGKYMSYLRLGNIIGSINRIPESILDIGYGNGSFLEVCSSIIKDCNGNDISNYPVPKNCKFVEDKFSRHFDVITFFDSLEHFLEIEWIKDLNCNFIVVSLPDCHYKDDEWFLTWKHRKPDEHLWHFNKMSLTSFMEKMGYTVVSLTNIEDTIRKNNSNESNIITGIFLKNHQ